MCRLRSMPSPYPTCRLCQNPCGPDHSTLCTHPSVSAARTRRHYHLLSTIESLLAHAPTVTTAREEHVHKSTTTKDTKARRADLRVTVCSRNMNYLTDLKVVNENAHAYARAPTQAAVTKQRSSYASYKARTGRDDIHTWVFTVGGQLAPQATEDLSRLAPQMGVQPTHLIATLYATVLNAHSVVHEAYQRAVSKLRVQ